MTLELLFKGSSENFLLRQLIRLKRILLPNIKILYWESFGVF